MRWLQWVGFLLLLYCPSVSAQSILLTQSDSTRAISLDSVTFTREPFALNSFYGRTRIAVFALNLPVTDPSLVTAEAEDGSHRIYQLKVEGVGRVPAFNWITQINLVLPDDLSDVGDVLLCVIYQGVKSNRVRLGVGHVGGGLADDGLTATVPPYTLKGRVLTNGVGLSNVPVVLSGAQTGLLLTDEQGRYSFTVTSIGKVTVTASLLYSAFTPQSQTLNPIYGNREVNFEATLTTKNLTGRILDDTNSPVSGVTLTLSGFQQGSTVSDSNGQFTFTNLWAGGHYTITPTKKGAAFVPETQSFDTLGANTNADFVLQPGVFDISGRVLEENGKAIAGAQVILSNGSTATTNENGFYLVRAKKGSYNINVVSDDVFNFSPATFAVNLSDDQTINFTGIRRSYSVSGLVQDDKGVGMDNVPVALGDKTTVTSGGGKYSFSGVTAGFSYTATASSTNIFNFTPQTFEVRHDSTANLQGVRRTYQISGRMTDGTNGVPDGLLTLDGSNTITTASDGSFSFTVTAGFDYTISARSRLYSFEPQTFKNVTANLVTSFIPTGVRRFKISGRLTEGTQPITNIAISAIEVHGLIFRQAYADANGNYSIDDVEPEYSYSVTAVDNEIYHFDPAFISAIDSDKTINFSGTRNLYTIKGNIADKDGPVSGVSVRLTGYAPSTTTDAAGNYSLNAPAGAAYQINLSKEDYIFSPPGLAIPYFYHDEKVNFAAIRTYTVSGRVVDDKGSGLPFVDMNLSGPENAKLSTNVNGDYFFTVTSPGNYTLVPVYPQNYYTFAPANQSFALTGHSVLNFVGTFAPLQTPSYVLEFDGTPATVDYSYYWPEGVDLGHFFWEFWAMPGDNADSRYLLSDGYGGSHALLFGFKGTTQQGRYTLSGNTWSISTPTSFFSDEGPAAKEWGHFAVGWDGKNIVVYFDGVPVGRTPFAGPRHTLGPNAGASWLFIGGSDHQNLIGRIAQVRGFEDRNPREAAPFAAFIPESVFSRDGNLLSYFFRPSDKVADLSAGYYYLHPGNLRGMLFGYAQACPGCPLPKYVIDSTAPNFSNPAPEQIQAPIDGQRPSPAGALIFDSFSRRNSTYILGGMGGLGSTETGNQTWQTGVTGRQPFGILNGRAVLLGDTAALAWVNAPQSNLQISVERLAGTAGAGVDTGLAFRVVDGLNYFFAYTVDGDKVYLGYYQQGVRHDLLVGASIPTGWRVLGVLTKADGTIEIQSSDGFVVYSLNNQTMATATGVGLYNNSPGLGLDNRWDNFTVSPAP